MLTQNVSAPYNNVGAFEMVWTPLPGPEEEDAGKELMDVESEEDLIGKPWTYRWVVFLYGTCVVEAKNSYRI